MEEKNFFEIVGKWSTTLLCDPMMLIATLNIESEECIRLKDTLLNSGIDIVKFIDLKTCDFQETNSIYSDPVPQITHIISVARKKRATAVFLLEDYECVTYYSLDESKLSHNGSIVREKCRGAGVEMVFRNICFSGNKVSRGNQYDLSEISQKTEEQLKSIIKILKKKRDEKYEQDLKEWTEELNQLLKFQKENPLDCDPALFIIHQGCKPKKQL